MDLNEHLRKKSKEKSKSIKWWNNYQLLRSVSSFRKRNRWYSQIWHLQFKFDHQIIELEKIDEMNNKSKRREEISNLDGIFGSDEIKWSSLSSSGLSFNDIG